MKTGFDLLRRNPDAEGEKVGFIRDESVPLEKIKNITMYQWLNGHLELLVCGVTGRKVVLNVNQERFDRSAKKMVKEIRKRRLSQNGFADYDPDLLRDCFERTMTKCQVDQVC